MKHLENRNRQIIDALIQKADRFCPGSLAMVGIYGSFQTGDFYEKSDLDLLVLINDDRGWQLSCTFLQDDLQVGHDIYCTTWESLEQDAKYEHPNISKLMDARIVYCANEAYAQRLESLRQQVTEILRSPLSREDLSKAEAHLREAEHSYALAMAADTLHTLWLHAGNILYEIENAIAMINKRYFRYGVKRVFEEIDGMTYKPQNFRRLTESFLLADSLDKAKQHLSALLAETVKLFLSVEGNLASPKSPVTANALRGTYEEMFSNWRNKIHTAARFGDRHLAFSCLSAMEAMLSDIAEETAIGDYSALKCYDPSDLMRTAHSCDELLQQYLCEYKKANLLPRQYPDIGAFAADYLRE